MHIPHVSRNFISPLAMLGLKSVLESIWSPACPVSYCGSKGIFSMAGMAGAPWFVSRTVACPHAYITASVPSKRETTLLNSAHKCKWLHTMARTAIIRSDIGFFFRRSGFHRPSWITTHRARLMDSLYGSSWPETCGQNHAVHPACVRTERKRCYQSIVGTNSDRCLQM